MSNIVEEKFPVGSKATADVQALLKGMGPSVSISELRGSDLSDYAYVYVTDLQTILSYNGLSTAPDDGAETLLDANDKRFIRSAYNFSIEFDDLGTLAERDAYDDEEKGFKFLVHDDASGDLVLYLKIGPTDSDWVGPYAVRGQQGVGGDNGFDFSGNGVPSDVLGEDGNTYLNIQNGDTYEKSAGTWGSVAGSIKGEKGDALGKRFTFSTATTDADPGSGSVRANNSDITAATFLYIDNADANAVDVSAWLDRLDDSTNPTDKGLLTLTNASDIAIYVDYTVTGSVIDGTGYRKIPVNYLGGSGSIADATLLFASFYKSGDVGASGAGTGDFLKDGSEAMTGNLSVGGNDIINVGDIDGRDVSADGLKLDEIYKINKYDATAAPTANDDSADTSGNGAFSVGSAWYDVTNDEAYKCLDATPTAAVWVTTSLELDELGGAALLDEATTAEYLDNTSDKLLSTDQLNAAGAIVDLVYSGSTIVTSGDADIDGHKGINFETPTLTQNSTLQNFDNREAGRSGMIYFEMDGTGGFTVTLDDEYELMGADSFDLPDGANERCTCAYFHYSATETHIWPPQKVGGA